MEYKYLRYLENHINALGFNLIANMNRQTDRKFFRFNTARSLQKLRLSTVLQLLRCCEKLFIYPLQCQLICESSNEMEKSLQRKRICTLRCENLQLFRCVSFSLEQVTRRDSYNSLEDSKIQRAVITQKLRSVGFCSVHKCEICCNYYS